MIQLPAQGKLQIPQSDEAVAPVTCEPESGQLFGDYDGEHEFISPSNLRESKKISLNPPLKKGDLKKTAFFSLLFLREARRVNSGAAKFI